MGRVLMIPLGLLALLLAAIVWSGGGVEKRADLTFINRGDIYTLDINQMSYMQDLRMTYAIREGLYGLDARTFRPVPAGATSCDISDDKLTWTFHLRRGCQWSNGDPVTAADYIFSWRRMLEDPGEYSYLFNYIRNAPEFTRTYADHRPIPFDSVGIHAPDPYTLVVELANPVPYLLDLVAFPPFYPRHEKSMERFKIVPDGEKQFPQELQHYAYDGQYTRPPWVVTNGPFEMERWDYHRRIVLKKSGHYWNRDKVALHSIEMLVNENTLGQFLDYETNRVDWVSEVLGPLGAELMAQGRKDLDVSPAFGTAFLIFMCKDQLPPDIGNGGTNPLADVRVRQALAMAIDKQFIIRNVTRMGELPATTYVPPDGTLPGYTWPAGPHIADKDRRYTAEECRELLRKGEAGPGLAYDVERARQLLAEAGFPDGRGFPALPMYYNTDSPVRAQMCEVLKNQWKEKLGIDINIQGKEGKAYKDVTNSHNYAIGLAAWYGDYPDASTFTDKYLSTSLNNESAWYSKEYDELCARAAREPDADKRLRMLEDAEAMINIQAPIVPIYHYVNGALVKPWISGLKVNPRNLQVFTAIRVEKH